MDKKALTLVLVLISAVVVTACSSSAARVGRETQSAGTKAVASSNSGVAIITLSSPVSPEATSTLFARAEPGTLCSVTVSYPAGATEKAGLQPKRTAPSGLVSWTWIVNPKAKYGTYIVTVTAKDASGKTAVAKRLFEIKSAKDCNK